MAELADRVAHLSEAQRALLNLRLEQRRGRAEPIAIIGMSCRYPGADSLEAFWRLLADGVDAITEVPAERWNAGDYYDADAQTPGKTNTRWGGFVGGLDRFDADFFGISPREAVHVDPQQRLLMEVAWEALEDAGVVPERLAGSLTGVFIGIFMDDFRRLLLDDPRQLDGYVSTGSTFCIAANRLSYYFDWHGPSMAIDTACSSSLVAIHLACQSLLNGEATMALAGGVNAILVPEPFIEMTKAGLTSPDGRCKSFDASANGYVRGEGAGIVVLKPLQRALADGDPIYAVIRGSAVNQDGRTNGITSPSRFAQEAVLRAACNRAGVSPAQVQYLEAHGTGTAVGDAIECRALGAVLGRDRPAERPLTLGSVKTNIGHLETAAGVAGLMKVALALQRRQIPASLHFKEPNPNVPFAEMSLRVQTGLAPWPRWEGQPALAGVNSFGFGGTNAHAILEEAPALPPAAAAVGPGRPLDLLALSARTAPALEELARRWIGRLQAAPAEPLADLCFSANTGRAAFAHRLAAVAATSEEMAEQLDLWLEEATPAPPAGERPRIAFLFTGQGAQYAGMARRLYEAQPIFRALLDRCQAVLAPHLERPLLSVLFPEPGQEDLLADTAYTQPALFALEYALAELWRSWGIVPDALLGHSVGEYAAACVAGAFSLEDGLELIARRARLMADLPREGAMAAIFAGAAEVEEAIAPLADAVSLAAVNGPHNTVISGRRDAVEEIAARFRARGVKAEVLQVSHAFHSPLLEPVLDRFEAAAGRLRYATPQLPLISNLTGEPFAAGEMGAAYWRRHARQPVRFAAGMEALRRAGCELFVEIGPGTTLLGMGAKAWQGEPALWLPSLRKGHDDWEQILSTLGALFCRGGEVDWRGFDRDYPRGRRKIPHYPFQRQRYWFDEAAGDAAGRPTLLQQLLGSRVESPVLAGTRLQESTLTARQPAALADHRVLGAVVVPGACYVTMALAAAEAPAGRGVELSDVIFGRALALPEGGRRTLQLAVTQDGAGPGRFAVYSRDAGGPPGGAWTLHASGELALAAGQGGNGRSLEQLRAAAGAEIDGDAFYREMAAREIELGPAFRCLERVWRRDGEALGQLRPAEAAGADGADGLQPGALDAAFQTIAAALPGAAAGATYMPLAIERLRYRSGSGQPAWCHGRVQSTAGGAAAYSGDLVLFDADGAVVAEVRGLQVKRVERWALQPWSEESIEECLYRVDWLPLPPPEPAEAAANGAQGVWLLAVGAPGDGDGIAALLAARGETALEIVVAGGEGAGAAGAGRLDPDDPEVLSRFLAAEVTGRGLSCRGAIHLAGLGVELRDDATAEQLLALQKRLCGSAVQLLQALARMDLRAWQRFALVTRGAQAVGPGDGAPAVASAPLWGLGVEILFEHPELSCLLVDLDPLAPEEEGLRQLLAEVSTHGEPRLAWRRGERLACRLVSAPAIGRGGDEVRTPIRPDGTYLITGGSGGLGLELARLLVGRGARHLVLAARRPAEGEALEGVERLRQDGAEVVLAAADVAEREQVAALLAGIDERMPPLLGVFHAAGAVDESRLLQQSWSRFAGVLRAKVLGTWNLHCLTRSRPLEHFVLFSSAASLLPILGLGSHAAANAFLDSFTFFRRAQGLPAVGVNWGAWGSLGRAAQVEDNAAVQRLWNEEGIEMMPPQQGIALMERLLGVADPPQVVAVLMSWPQLLQRFPDGNERPHLAYELSRRRPSAGAAAARQEKAGLGELLQAASPEEQRERIAAYLREQVTKILRLPSAQEIDPQRPLQAFGLDSLMAIELRNRLKSATGHDLPATLLFDHPTLSELEDFLADLLGGAAVPPPADAAALAGAGTFA